jgi:hypothetical protein
MTTETPRQIDDAIEADVQSRPSPIKFGMAYQARVAIDRIRFAIKHAEQFARPCEKMREIGLELLDALERLDALDRRFRARSRMSTSYENRSAEEARGRTHVQRL